jgi:hypothetical protein
MSTKFKLVLRPEYLERMKEFPFSSSSPELSTKRGRGRPRKIKTEEVPKRPRGRPAGRKTRRERKEIQKDVATELLSDINLLGVSFGTQLMDVKKRIKEMVPSVKLPQERIGRPNKYKTIEEMRQHWRELYYIKKAKKNQTQDPKL